MLSAEAPYHYLSLPPLTTPYTTYESTYTSSMTRREPELQSTCLDINALFELFVLVAVWATCDLLIKFGYIARQFYRCIRRQRSKKYAVQEGGNDSTLSEDYVTGATSIPLRPMTSTPRPLRLGIVIVLNFGLSLP